MHLHHSLRITTAIFVVVTNVSAVLAASTTFSPPAQQDSNIFVPFLKRYVRMQGLWRGALTNQTTMRFVGPTEGDVASSFTISQLPRNTCAIGKLQERLAAKYATTPTGGWKIGRESVMGLSGSAFKWQEETANGPELHWCVIPPGSVLTSEIFTAEEDTQSATTIRDHILKFLAQAERKSRPVRVLPESKTQTTSTMRNRPVRRTLRSSIRSWQDKSRSASTKQQPQ